MSKEAKLKEFICNVIKPLKNPNKAKGQEKYMKNVIKCQGLDSKQIQQLFKTKIYPEMSEFNLKEKVDFAYSMLMSKYYEEKQIGIAVIHKNVKQIAAEKCEEDGETPYAHIVIQEIGDLFEQHIYDWATTDCISSRVICELMKQLPDSIPYQIHTWRNDSDTMWRQRAACVSFVKIARFGNYNDLIIDIANSCIRNQERFVQLGCGWALRELSLADRNLVVDFIKKNYEYFSREGLRYAIEKMDPDTKNELLQYGKKSNNIRTKVSKQ